ncbi:Ribonuclease III domain containing protein, putative [Angomonas deanei]|uniref:Ribonuclease III domain containing protein, putative n=1 Tax=Angomonas deanei TaxID=59799 RepID=A0A7G2C619_9TRYP|nr:Ribonuclease III domain containing protein, putative [Angomonas deanei]
MDRNRPHTHTSQEKIPYRYHRRHHALPALQRQRRRLSFERVEYLGDCSWGHFLTDRMLLLFPQQQWGESKNAIGFNAVKTCVEMNLSLEFFFDFLDLQKLVQSFYSGTWWAGETAYFNNHHNGSAGPSVQYLGSGSGKLAARLSNKNKNNNNNNNNNENSGEKQVEDGARKIKADVVEAILGELHLTLYHLEQSLDDVPNDFNDYSNFLNFCAGPPSSERLVEATVEDYRALFLQDKRLATTVIRHCLNEFYDLVMLFYIRGMIHSVLPIANEMAAYSVWGNKEIVPLPLRHQKQFRSVKQQRLTQRIRYTNNNNDNYKEESVLGIARPPVGLPPLPRLFPSPVGKTKLKEEETPLHYLNPFLDDHNNNKYETIAAYYPQCINENLKQDVFARFEQSYKTLHLVSKNRKSSFIQGSICPAWSLLRYTLVPLLYLQEQEGKLDTPGELNINNSKNNNNSPPLPLFALQTPEEALQRSFFRDAFYSLKEVPSSNNKNNMNHNSVLEYLKQNSMTAEPITKEPVSNHNHHQTNNNAVKVAYHFSRYVPSPDAVRHASAVVADKTYFKGVFAFLGTASLFSKNNPTESEFDPFSILSETKNEKEEKKLSENKETTENNNNNDKVEEAYRLWKKEHYTLVYNSGKMKEYFD